MAAFGIDVVAGRQAAGPEEDPNTHLPGKAKDWRQGLDAGRDLAHRRLNPASSGRLPRFPAGRD